MDLLVSLLEKGRHPSPNAGRAGRGGEGKKKKKAAVAVAAARSRTHQRSPVTFSQHHSRARSRRKCILKRLLSAMAAGKVHPFTGIYKRPPAAAEDPPVPFIIFLLFLLIPPLNPARGVATHRLISEGGRLGGRHVVIGRLQRKLLHFLVLVQMNHLHRENNRELSEMHRAQKNKRQIPRRPAVRGEVIVTVSPTTLKHQNAGCSRLTSPTPFFFCFFFISPVNEL